MEVFWEKYNGFSVHFCKSSRHATSLHFLLGIANIAFAKTVKTTTREFHVKGFPLWGVGDIRIGTEQLRTSVVVGTARVANLLTRFAEVSLTRKKCPNVRNTTAGFSRLEQQQSSTSSGPKWSGSCRFQPLFAFLCLHRPHSHPIQALRSCPQLERTSRRSFTTE